MPAEHSTPSKKSGSKTTSEVGSPSKSWSIADKSLLFEHVRMNGEKDWDKAVPGKSAQQCREQWKRILLPMIRSKCGLLS